MGQKNLLLQRGKRIVRPEVGEDSYEIVSFVHDSGMAFEDTRTGSHAQVLHRTKPVKSTTSMRVRYKSLIPI